MTCSHCGLPLSESRFTDGEKWKSCPRCSQFHGSQHVFLPRPKETFGTTPRRVTGPNPEGFQSHCTPCRAGDTPDLAAGTLCSELMSAA